MKRPWHIWTAFVACLAVVLAAMGWISGTALQLDRAERRMRAAAALEEDVRLALWRMDSHLWTLVSQEAARPYFTYSPVYAADRSFTGTLQSPQHQMEPGPGQVLIPSPLLAPTPPHCRLYFQVQVPGTSDAADTPRPLTSEGAAVQTAAATDPTAGRERHFMVTCPQVPGPWKTHLDPQLLNEALIAESEQRLAEFIERIDTQELVAAVPAAPLWPVDRSGSGAPSAGGAASDSGFEAAPEISPPQVEDPFAESAQPSADVQAIQVQQPADLQVQRGQQPQSAEQAQALAKNRAGRYLPPQQQQFNTWEYTTRLQGYQQLALANALRPNNIMPITEDVKIGLMCPVWVGGELLLARWVEVGSNRLLQGVWLDWPSLKQELLATVADLFPDAALTPLEQPREQQGDRLLSLVPARFSPGAELQLESSHWSPAGVSLLMAWGCVLLAAVAVGTLLAGVVRLSERRASFVSAVTHELRTPLTTFRIYADMLAEGMVPDVQRQQAYLDTLRTEADRLGHLVENVLAYARLERGRQRRQPQELTVAELMQSIGPRLAERAARDGMRLETTVSALAGERTVRTDVSALEQILFNLVDNACKYARDARPLIQIDVAPAGPGLLRMTVRDYGPGIGPREGRQLFRAFHKSAQDAAHSAPGVGLGLALSRRLARELGGNLAIDAAIDDGAAFVLTLPLLQG